MHARLGRAIPVVFGVLFCVCALPVRASSCQYHAIDLGGSNFRLLTVELDGAGSMTSVAELVSAVPHEVSLLATLPPPLRSDREARVDLPAQVGCKRTVPCGVCLNRMWQPTGGQCLVRHLASVNSGAGAVARAALVCIGAQMMRGHGSTLFGYIADAVKRWSLPPGSHVGFTFSFPVNQTALNSGTLLQWTKRCGMVT